MSTTLVTQLLDRLAAARVAARPFSHVYLHDVFPESWYADLRHCLPPLPAYAPDNPAKYGPTVARLQQRGGLRGLGVDVVQSCRYILPLNDQNLRTLDGDSRRTWSAVRDALASQALQDALRRTFADDLARRFGAGRNGSSTPALHARVTLVRDLAGYWIAPHPDSRAKVITMQFYLPADLSQASHGTTLYRRRLFDPRNLFSLRHLFEPVVQLPFVPNTAYAFPVGRRSWHGREALPDDAAVRDSILLVLYQDASRQW